MKQEARIIHLNDQEVIMDFKLDELQKVHDDMIDILSTISIHVDTYQQEIKEV